MLKLKAGEKGFTFIEVLIALLILSIFSGTFLFALATSSRSVVLANERTTAESLARCQLESLETQPYIFAEDVGVAVYSLTSSSSRGYSINCIGRAGAEIEGVVGVPWDSDSDSEVTQDAGLQMVTIVIKHGDKVVFTLQSYKVAR